MYPVAARFCRSLSALGFDTAQNLSKYASYLDRRIRTFGAIKYDIIRDKSERKGMIQRPSLQTKNSLSNSLHQARGTASMDATV